MLFTNEMRIVKEEDGILLIIVITALSGVFLHSHGQGPGKGEQNSPMNIQSKAFPANGMIPSQFTCDGANISPELDWEGVPANTLSFALVCDDPDAPMGTWVHWILYNIPGNIKQISENFQYKNKPVKEILAGMNDFRKLEWGGPCPPSGTHRYFFRLYAVDCFLNEKEGLSSLQLMKALEGHVLAKAELVGRYKRKQ